MKRVQLLMVLCICLMSTQTMNATVKLICPENIELGCNPKKIPVPKPNDLDYETDCRKAKVRLIDRQLVEEDCKITMTLTYEAEDRCGDTDQCKMTITWTQDEEPPQVMNCVEEIDLGCNPEEIPEPDLEQFEVKDNCGIRGVVLHSEEKKTKRCEVFLTRTYRVYDNCGNYTTCVQTLYWIEDGEPPVFTKCPEDIDLGCNLDDLEKLLDPDNAKVEAKDRCGKVEIEYLGVEEFVEDCQINYVQTWKATDACGNMSFCTRRIKLSNDNTPPEIVQCPESGFLGCFTEDNQPDIDRFVDQLIVEDDCGWELIPSPDTILFGECRRGYSREYIVVDACGNRSSCYQKVTWLIDDGEGPEFTICPPDLELGCDPDLSLYENPVVEAEDPCGEVEITREPDQSIQSDECTFKILQSWTAVDACGNESKCFRVIKYFKSNPVKITHCLPDRNLGCVDANFELPPPRPDLIEYEGGCGEIFVSSETFEPVFDQCCATVVRRYIVNSRGPCLSADTCEQIFTWCFDDNPPVFTECPSDIDLGCNPSPGDILVDPNQANVKAEDACSEVDISYEGQTITEEGCLTIITQTWKATDRCGNMSFCSRDITFIKDEEPPVVTSCPEDIDLGCFIEPILFVEDQFPPVVITGEDRCGDVEVEYLGITEEKDGCMIFLIRTWALTDPCGNVSYCEQVLKYTLDPEPPKILECPPNIDLGCVEEGFELPEPDLDGVIFEDNCDATVTAIPFQDIVVFNCVSEWGYLYIVEDACGNRDSCVQLISWIFDVTPPEFTMCPPDLDLGCNPDLTTIADPSINAVAAEDFCGEVDIERLEDVVIIGDDCVYKRIQTWKATDRCGNMSTCSRVIKYTLDEEQPTIISCPQDIDYGCVQGTPQLPPFNPEDIVAEDNCEIASIIHVDQPDFTDPCLLKIDRLITVLDRCGNFNSCVQTFTWTNDQTPPQVISCPPDLNFGCVGEDFEIPEPTPEDVVAIDNCGDVEVTVDVGIDIVLVGCEFRLVRRYLITDRCGNTAQCEQRITWIRDDTPPEFTFCPPDIDLGCNPNPSDILIDPSQETPEAVDACGDVRIEFFGEERDEDGCEVIITQTWKATDRCDNMSFCSRIIRYFISENEQINVTCNGSENYGCVENRPEVPPLDPEDIVVEGGCGEMDTFINVQLIEVTECYFIFRRFIGVEDQCGNTGGCVQDFSWTLVNGEIEDIPFPENMNINCGEIPPIPPFDNQTNCGVNVPELVEVTVEGDCSTGNCVIRRFWRKTDCFGDITGHVQVITLTCFDVTSLRNQITTRTIEDELNGTWKVFPNPGVQDLTIETALPENTAYQIEMYDLSGKRIWNQRSVSAGMDIWQVPVTDLHNGVYLIQLITGSQVETIKWIKTH